MPEEDDAESTTTASPAGTPHTPEPSATGTRNVAALATYAALAFALVAVVLAALAYFHPAHHNAAGPIQQDGDSKTNVCGAFAAVRKAVVLNTHLQSPDNNPVGELAVAGNARLALVGGGAYLQRVLAANTAAPADLTKSVSSFADTIEQLGVGYLAGGNPDTLQPLRHKLDTQISDTVKLCAE